MCPCSICCKFECHFILCLVLLTDSMTTFPGILSRSILFQIIKNSFKSIISLSIFCFLATLYTFLVTLLLKLPQSTRRGVAVLGMEEAHRKCGSTWRQRKRDGGRETVRACTLPAPTTWPAWRSLPWLTSIKAWPRLATLQSTCLCRAAAGSSRAEVVAPPRS